MKLSDSAISHIAKVLQVAILTGTDIVDNMRMMEFETEDGELYLGADYSETFEKNVNKMLDEVTSVKENSQTIELSKNEPNSIF